MFAVRLVFALAALYAVVEAHNCGQTFFGELTYDGYNLNPFYIYGNDAYYETTYPNVCKKLGKVLAGVHVRVCDDVAPYVDVIDWRKLVVYRRGSLLDAATVFIKEDCVERM